MSWETEHIPRKEDKHRAQQEGGVDAWLMTYADMITLLMCFFIIFVSVSEPKRDTFSEIAEGLADRFGTVDTSTPLKGVFEALQKTVETQQLLRDVSIERTESGIAMEIASKVLFEPGAAEITQQHVRLLSDLSASLKTVDYLDYRVIVEGHTSDAQLPSASYPTNWELSSTRAAHVVLYLIDQGIKPERLRAVAFAETRPKVPNLGAGGQPIIENREINDRVVIKLERVL